VGTGGIAGLYSLKVKKLADLRDGATIGILADPVVVRRADVNNPRIKRLIEIFQTDPEVRDVYTKYSGKLVKFTWLDTGLDEILNVPDGRYP
jgi:ABC-type metal ion transport system substrate-binding protein